MPLYCFALRSIFHFGKNFVHRDTFHLFFFSLLRPPFFAPSLLPHFIHTPSKYVCQSVSIFVLPPLSSSIRSQRADGQTSRDIDETKKQRACHHFSSPPSRGKKKERCSWYRWHSGTSCDARSTCMSLSMTARLARLSTMNHWGLTFH